MAGHSSSMNIDETSNARAGNVLRDLWAVSKTLLVIIFPLALLPLPILSESKEVRCAYGLAVMAVLWTTESLPLAVTSLLPMIIFPFFEVMKASEVAGNYIKESTMFSFGGLTVAIAVEGCGLHKRIALRTLTFVGSDPRWILDILCFTWSVERWKMIKEHLNIQCWSVSAICYRSILDWRLMLGFMLPTWFLSMWISNTATTAMMIPIVSAVIDELRRIKHRSEEQSQSNEDLEKRVCVTYSKYITDHTTTTTVDLNKNDEEDIEDEAQILAEASPSSSTTPFDATDRSKDSPEFTRLCKGFCLCVAYAANVGGTGTMSGTAPNVIMQGQAEILFGAYGLDSGVNFASWLVFALPGSIICLCLAWMYLQTIFLGKTSLFCCMSKSRGGQERIKQVIREEYEKLGKIRFAEVAVLVHLVTLVLLWMTRKVPYVGGWGQFLPSGYVGDSAAAIFIVVCLFVFPSRRPSVFFWRRPGEPSVSVPSLLTWEEVNDKFPWDVMLLVGGGFTLADACEKSGLSRWIGNNLTVFSSLQPSTMNLVLTLLIAAATEVTSNTATASLLLPIAGNLALSLNLNPLFLMFPCAIATSFAFMLPVATPPNAIVFANGYVKVYDMAAAGFGMNIVCVLVLTLAVNTWGAAYFNLHTLPEGFPVNNGTLKTL